MLDVSSHGIMCEGEERDFMNNNTDDNNIDKDNVNTDAAEEIVAEETIFGGTETEPETAASDAAIPDGAGIPIFPDNEASDEADEPDDKPAKKDSQGFEDHSGYIWSGGRMYIYSYIDMVHVPLQLQDIHQ